MSNKQYEMSRLYYAAMAVANAIHAGLGPMIRGTMMEDDLREALGLKPGELGDVPKGSTTDSGSEVEK